MYRKLAQVGVVQSKLCLLPQGCWSRGLKRMNDTDFIGVEVFNEIPPFNRLSLITLTSKTFQNNLSFFIIKTI